MSTTLTTKSGTGVPMRQYSPAGVLAVWTAAAVPMAVLAWIVAPALAGTGATDRRFAVNLIIALTAGLVWQCVLVLALVARERRSLRWPVMRDALWLLPPTGRDGRRGGRVWLWTLPFILGFAVLQLVPFGLSGPSNHDFGAFLASTSGRDTLQGNWGLFALILVMFLFNTVLGEELLFRGLLLPRMRGAFGKADWIVNGLLMGVYHLHQPGPFHRARWPACSSSPIRPDASERLDGNRGALHAERRLRRGHRHDRRFVDHAAPGSAAGNAADTGAHLAPNWFSRPAGR